MNLEGYKHLDHKTGETATHKPLDSLHRHLGRESLDLIPRLAFFIGCED